LKTLVCGVPSERIFYPLEIPGVGTPGWYALPPWGIRNHSP
jgi:hypothetical protein